MEIGIEKGEVCNRNGCKGVLTEHYSDHGCSCHISPPCSYCTTDRTYCPECEYDGEEEQRESEIEASKSYYKGFGSKEMHDAYYDQENKRKAFMQKFELMYNGREPAEKLITIHESHTHFSQIIRGVFPKGSETSKTLRENHGVKGAFGGRFERINDFSFKFIAYTD